MNTDYKLDAIILLLKRLTESKIRILTKEDLERFQGHIADTSKKVKATRYYPNGAYMDEPKNKVEYFVLLSVGEPSSFTWSSKGCKEHLELQNCFPTKEAAEKELKRQKLTAKMYRDMREESINGDWVADWEDIDEQIYYPIFSLSKGIDWDSNVDYDSHSTFREAHTFYYKNKTFIEDLKALGWTEEELKIVWFNN